MDSSIIPSTAAPMSERSFGQHGAAASAVARQRIADERQKKVVALAMLGVGKAEIARELGVNERTIRRDLIDSVGALRDVAIVIESLDLDASDALRALTDAHDADLADLYHDLDRCPETCACRADPAALVGTLRPVAQWPAVWRRGIVGDIKIEPNMVRSKDGGDTSWDRDGDKITIHVKAGDRIKVLELAMRHKQVNALVEQKQGDVNVMVVTADKARQVAGARKRLAKVIPVIPVEAMPSESMPLSDTDPEKASST